MSVPLSPDGPAVPPTAGAGFVSSGGPAGAGYDGPGGPAAAPGVGGPEDADRGVSVVGTQRARSAGEVVADRPDREPAGGDGMSDGLSPGADRDAATGRPARLGRELAIYSAMRLAMIAVLTAILAVFMPLVVALMFAIIIQLPLAWVVFARQRRRVNEAVALASSSRRRHRQELREALEGGRD